VVVEVRAVLYTNRVFVRESIYVSVSECEWIYNCIEGDNKQNQVYHEANCPFINLIVTKDPGQGCVGG
jgi:hypothetical protein